MPSIQTSIAGSPRWIAVFVFISSLFWGVGFASGKSFAIEPDLSAAPLRAKHAELAQQLLNNQFQRALYLDSAESSHDLKGEIYAVVNYPFAIVNTALNNPAHWCDVLILHINIKYCHANKAGTALTVNIGRKYDQPLSSAYRLDFNYRAVLTTQEYFAVELNAENGPLNTHNYHIWIEATPVKAMSVKDERTFLHVTYAYAFGLPGRLAMQSYLSTIGRDKIGFTIIGKLPDGQPAYIRGIRGVVERNTMRYYLAIDAYLAALTAPPQDQLEKRLQHWFTNIEQYARQLHEVERADYLEMKRREYQRQQLAQ